MNNLNLSNYYDLSRVRYAVYTARNSAKSASRQDNAPSSDVVRFLELEAMAYEMDAKVLETETEVLSKEASCVELAKQGEITAKIALARAYRDEADARYQTARKAWLAE